MTEQPKDVPKRSAYKAGEVCDIARIQPYVLRTWESEFPRLGVVRGGVRIYRHTDLEQVLRIRQLVFEEGLTLAGARRRIEGDTQPQAELPLEQFVTQEVRERIARVRQGLQDLLGMLGGRSVAADGGSARAASGDGHAAAASASPHAAAKASRKAVAAPRAKPKAGHKTHRHIGRA